MYFLSFEFLKLNNHRNLNGWLWRGSTKKRREGEGKECPLPSRDHWFLRLTETGRWNSENTFRCSKKTNPDSQSKHMSEVHNPSLLSLVSSSALFTSQHTDLWLGVLTTKDDHQLLCPKFSLGLHHLQDAFDWLAGLAAPLFSQVQLFYVTRSPAPQTTHWSPVWVISLARASNHQEMPRI